eukprot:CAMPEP_0174374188 /NCGR_PEP_ID=MMETSP0811_2-20130205/109997_1 /TAXON_ID=73025 ORGANISM="Eutreptiella gymnastica-like, Strain CCMP1594" /NCGR_SAMPLE_ID=MMETSP0811_2 /ASSEMBLY_ACC=CAM_ASM_000667 /LENGTH=86 /DNA_ID=CAMNT_0015523291 /DNA_START=1 /DNA_END=262 /DNA_ORIENTATION=-
MHRGVGGDSTRWSPSLAETKIQGEACGCVPFGGPYQQHHLEAYQQQEQEVTASHDVLVAEKKALTTPPVIWRLKNLANTLEGKPRL